MTEHVEAGGRKFEVIQSGDGQPAVIFESGAGRPASNWAGVISALDCRFRKFAYSRAGVGTSDPCRTEDVIFDEGGIQVASPESRATDLHCLLGAAGVPAPYVLVGHSIGGILARLFAAKYPESVAGIVFVDSGHPDQVSRMPIAVRRSRAPEELKEAFVGNWPGPNAPVIEAASSTGPFGDMPIAVISRDPNRPYDPASYFPEELHPTYEERWARLQEELVQLSSDSTHIVVPGADHAIHLNVPEVVAETIQDVIDRIPTGQRSD